MSQIYARTKRILSSSGILKPHLQSTGWGANSASMSAHHHLGRARIEEVCWPENAGVFESLKVNMSFQTNVVTEISPTMSTLVSAMLQMCAGIGGQAASQSHGRPHQMAILAIMAIPGRRGSEA